MVSDSRKTSGITQDIFECLEVKFAPRQFVASTIPMKAHTYTVSKLVQCWVHNGSEPQAKCWVPLDSESLRGSERADFYLVPGVSVLVASPKESGSSSKLEDV